VGQIHLTNYPFRVGKLPQTVTPNPTGVHRDLLRLFPSLTSAVRSPCPDIPESSQELWVIQWVVSEVTMCLGAGTIKDTLLPLCLFSLSLSHLKSLHLLLLSLAHENLAVPSISLFNLTHSFTLPVLFPLYQRVCFVWREREQMHLFEQLCWLLTALYSRNLSPPQAFLLLCRSN